MSSAESKACSLANCEKDTVHVPGHRTALQTVTKIAKYVVFFVSFGMVYPHIFTDED